MRIERIPSCKALHWNHEVPSRIPHQPFHLPLVVDLRWASELVGKQIVTLRLGDGPRALPLRAAKDLRQSDLRVVVENASRHAAEVRERSHMAFEKRLRRLGRKRRHKTVVRVRRVHRQIVRLALYAADHNYGFAEVNLVSPKQLSQRFHE